MSRLLIIILTMLVCSEITAQVHIRVKLGIQPKEVVVSIKEGRYALIAADKDGYALDTVWCISSDETNRLLRIKQIGNEVEIHMHELGRLRFSEIWLVPFSDRSDPSFIIAGIDKRERWYQDALHAFISKENNHITIVNDVALEKYVAGVVESEGGAFAEMEYFKAQAVLARTFAIKNMKKHLHLRYNLRDDVSSQVYHSRAYFKNAELIRAATAATEDTIITDANGTPLAALFHANSGGQTANAGDVWSNNLPYLRSKPDPFSVNQTSYRWEKQIPKKEVLAYLSRQLNTAASDTFLIQHWESFTQDQRKSHFTYNGKSIKLSQIRSRFKLRSTFFNVDIEGDAYLLKGRGYGHGVGLSQDGAINMSSSGFSFKDILYFYYEKSDLKNLTELLNLNETLRELVIQNTARPVYRYNSSTVYR